MKTLTSFILPSAHRKKWYILDCKMYQSLSFGRIGPTVVQTLIGKNISSYDPSTDIGNYVILIKTNVIFESYAGLLLNKPATIQR